LKANADNVSRAEKQARIVAGQLADRSFDWTPYLRGTCVQPETIGDWVKRFEKQIKPTISETTWRSDYYNVLSRLPGDAPLTAEVLIGVIAQTTANTRQRKRFCTTLGRLAKFAGLEIDLSSLRGNYSELRTEPRDLPDDGLIVQAWKEIRDPGWRWVYGAIATFGLRNHEAFYLDLTDLLAGGESVRVTEGKTGARRVWAYYPEWIDAFALRQRQLPKVRLQDRSHERLGRAVSKFFSRNIPFECYNLRHCWAVRTVLFGLDPTLAAKQMGHSVEVHQRVYHRWLDESVQERNHQALKQNPYRPQPPSV
jgi:hypothetical protein